MDDLLTEFIAETRETLCALSGEIVAWEAKPADRDRLDAIFRFVHTVKGSCGFLDLPRLARLSHAAEDVLDQVRSGVREADRALVSAVLAIIDRIRDLVDAIENGEAIPDGEDTRLIDALTADAGDAQDQGGVPLPSDAPRAVARTIRVPIELLDRLMAGVSDMVLARNEVGRRIAEAALEGPLNVSFERLSICIADLRDAVTRTRMQRIDGLFSALPRIVRDVSAELGKQVTLEIDGGDVELDREMIEMLRDPLTHIVRNAIDHGIEAPDLRVKAGKRPAGVLRISARQSGNQIVIEIDDDGRGIDMERLTARAVSAGIVDAENARVMPLQRRLALIFEPGLSTAPAVTAISGRGVGMDVVRANVERVGGTIDVENRAGQGLRLTLRVPLTLTIIPALTLRSGGHDLALPRSAIEEIVRVDGEAIRLHVAGGRSLVSIRGRRLPVLSLSAILGGSPQPTRPEQVLVVLRPAGRQLFALAVDDVLDHEELVVKPAAPAIMAAGIYGGTTLAQNGRPMMLLDPAGLAAVGQVGSAAADPEPTTEAPLEGVSQWRALLFEDMDGARRAIRLSIVDRVEDLTDGAISQHGGRQWLADGERLLPVFTCDGAPRAGPSCMLRLSDGDSELGYAVRQVVDIVMVPDHKVAPAADPRLTGVALIAGDTVELIDPYALFAQIPERRSPAGPVCILLAGDEHWTREVLRPLVEAAGYTVLRDSDTSGIVPDLIIANDWSAVPPPEVPAPVLRLRREAAGGADSIYRYDRAGLLAALAVHGCARASR